MIYTTYFAKISKLPLIVKPIAICGKSPDWYKGLEYKKLAPKASFFKEWKETGDDDFYIRSFKSYVLDQLDPHQVENELYSLAGTQNIALLCYEKPDEFCHRHLVSAWFRLNGIDCSEMRF